MMQPFLWSGNSGQKITPGQAKVLRELALQRANRPTPANLGEGLSSIGDALVNVSANMRADEAESAGRKQVTDALASQNWGGVIADPWADPTQQGYAASMLERGWELSDRDAAWTREDELRSQPNWQTFEAGGDRYRYNSNAPEWVPEQFFDGPDDLATNPVSYGTSLQYGRDAAGNLVPLQAGDNGTLVRSQLPPGVVAIDPGAAAGARAGATFDAKTVAAANAALPAVEQNLGIALDAIDRLRNDKAGLEANFSQWGALPRGMYVQGGTPLANWMTNLNQASGQAFMQARQALKGGGQITDYEGKRAEAAISRISDAAKSGDVQTFLDALDEFEAAVTDGYAKLREVAGGNYQPGAGPGAGTGDIFDRYGLER